MKFLVQTPKQPLNNAYLKEKVCRTEIEAFKGNFLTLLARINEGETEEHNNHIVAGFLKETWYKEQYEINTKSRNNLVLHTGGSKKKVPKLAIYKEYIRSRISEGAKQVDIAKQLKVHRHTVRDFIKQNQFS